LFLGAMVGSTTCSIKTLRWVIVAKTVRRQLFLAVRPVRLDGEPIDEEIIPDALVFVLLSIVLVLLLMPVVVIDTPPCRCRRQRVRGTGCGGSDVPHHRSEDSGSQAPSDRITALPRRRR
jgi:trk system potassium uptake protein TrkH